MSALETSIIIPTHNRRKILKKSLTALNEQIYPSNKYEIIVIDDGSSDGTKAMVENLNLAPKLIYRYQEQQGPAASRNHGIKLSQGQFIIFIDDDIIVTPDFIKAHINIQKKKEKVISHGPVIYTNNLDNPTAEEKKITDYSRAFFATGNVSLRKKYLIKAGLFNESFYEYGWEDLELGKRLQKLNLKKVKTKPAKGYHYKKKFIPENIPNLLQRERKRGRMAVIYNQINPNFEVKLQTLNWKPIFWLKNLLTLAHWPQWNITYKLVEYAHNHGWKKLCSFLVYFMKLEAYFKGLKQGPDQQSQ